MGLGNVNGNDIKVATGVAAGVTSNLGSLNTNTNDINEQLLQEQALKKINSANGSNIVESIVLDVDGNIVDVKNKNKKKKNKKNKIKGKLKVKKKVKKAKLMKASVKKVNPNYNVKKKINNKIKKLNNLGNPNTFNMQEVYSSSSYSIAQGACETEKYKLICFRRADNNKDGKARLIIINKKTGKVVKQIDNLPFDHANGMTYDENTGIVYVANCGNGKDAKKISYFSLEDALNGGKLKIKTKKIKINGEAIKVSAISYDNVTNTMYVGAGSTVYALDKNGNATEITKIQQGVPQDIYANKGYLYVVRYNPNGKDKKTGINTSSSSGQANSSKNIIDVYKNGEYVGSKSIKTGGENYELESLSYSGKGNKFTLYFNHIGTSNGTMGEVNLSVPC